MATVLVASASGCNCAPPGGADDAGSDAGQNDAGLRVDAGPDCNGHGTMSGGNCSCATGFTGNSCERCDEFYLDYPRCVFCNRNTTCNGNGVCSAQGTCVCDQGFADAGCGECAPGFTGYPNCM